MNQEAFRADFVFPKGVKPSMNHNFNMKYVWAISLVAAMGGLLFGYDWVVIGGAKIFYETFFQLSSESEKGWAISCALAGCLLGAIASGGLSDKFGRKRLLILAAFMFTATSIGTGMANSFSAFVVWRLLGGAAIGLASNLSPMYIAEVSPAHLRGLFVSINQLTIVIGILLAQVVNYLITQPVPTGATDLEILNSWNGQIGWRVMFIATAAPSFFFLMLMFLVPDSPRWLAKNGKHQRAHSILARIGGNLYADGTIADIEQTLVNEIERVNFKDLLEPKMLKILLIGVILAVYQQWCGINVIFYYAPELFKDAGFQVNQVFLNIVYSGTANLVFTFVALFTVDLLGRKALMLAGSAGLAITYILLGGCYFFEIKGFTIVLLASAAIGCYAFSLAPVTWVILSEIFPNRIRGAAMSVSVFALWTACFLLADTFLHIYKKLGPDKTFWIFSAICLAGFIFIMFKLPETKGKTLEDIQRELVD